jgi:hypothetical protein
VSQEKTDRELSSGYFFVASARGIANDGKCEWTKRYFRKHSVTYRGVNGGHGIWGVWEIRQLAGLYVDRGGFHIWPEGTDVSQESDQTEQAVLAAMRQEFGSRLSRAVRWLLI